MSSACEDLGMAWFSDPVHDEFAGLVLGLAPYGGGDVGEVERLATQVTPGDDASFFAAFDGLAQRRIEEAEAAAAKGHTATARDCYLRAALLLGVGYHPLFGVPVDPRLADAFRRQMAAFDRVMELGQPPGEKLEVPYDGTHLPVYFVRAPWHEHDVRPLLLVGGGWDSTMVENYLGMG